jgi:hypothetical protein
MLLSTLLLAGCAAKIDRFTLDRVVDRGGAVPDTGKACAMGAALAFPLGSLTRNEPHLALTVAEGVGAVCDEVTAWEAELASLRAKHNAAGLGEGRVAEITDARLEAVRAHARTAARFETSFQQLQAAYGPVGEGECPKIAEKDEFAYLFGLVTGTLALLHDRASGGANDVPMDRLGAIARGAACLDDARWWSVPSALRGSAWATIPGSGPEGTDPWELLEEAATMGEASGVRVARAMQVLIASNSGEMAVLAASLQKHAASLQATPPNPDWRLLDTYAYEVSLHQSDLLWTEERGHRTEVFGTVPGEPTVPEPAPDPFASDPFGAGPAEPEPEGTAQKKEETP